MEYIQIDPPEEPTCGDCRHYDEGECKLAMKMFEPAICKCSVDAGAGICDYYDEPYWHD